MDFKLAFSACIHVFVDVCVCVFLCRLESLVAYEHISPPDWIQWVLILCLWFQGERGVCPRGVPTSWWRGSSTSSTSLTTACQRCRSAAPLKLYSITVVINYYYGDVPSLTFLLICICPQSVNVFVPERRKCVRMCGVKHFWWSRLLSRNTPEAKNERFLLSTRQNHVRIYRCGCVCVVQSETFLVARLIVGRGCVCVCSMCVVQSGCVCVLCKVKRFWWSG